MSRPMSVINYLCVFMLLFRSLLVFVRIERDVRKKKRHLLRKWLIISDDYGPVYLLVNIDTNLILLEKT